MISIFKKLVAQWRDHQNTPLTYDYVEEVLKGLTYKLNKPDIRAELNSHFDESIEYYKSQGFNEEDAYTLAKEAMGNPQEVIDSFNELYNWQYRLHTVASLIAFTSVLFLIFRVAKPMFDDYQNYKIETGWSIEMQLKSKESVKIDKRIQFGTLHLDFETAYLTENNNLVLYFEAKKSNPFMRTWPMITLVNSCDNHVCYISNNIPTHDNAFIVVNDYLLYVEDIEEIPSTLTFTLESISGKSETFTLHLRGEH